MTTKDTGGPAFPTQEQRFPDGEMNVEATYGMNLRDYFAAQALQALVHNRTPNQAAIEAYEYANAMLAERNKQ